MNQSVLFYTPADIVTSGRVIAIMRHGQREDYVNTTWGITAPRPQDPSLSEKGKEEIRLVAEDILQELEQEGIHTNEVVILASPLVRTVQSAEIVAETLKIPGSICLEPCIIEESSYIGVGYGHFSANKVPFPIFLSPKELSQTYGNINQSYVPFYVPIFYQDDSNLNGIQEMDPQGSDERDSDVLIQRRCQNFIDNYVLNPASVLGKYRAIIIIGHGSSVSACAQHLTQESQWVGCPPTGSWSLFLERLGWRSKQNEWHKPY